MIIDFHFVTLVHTLQPLDLIITQYFFTDMHDYSDLVVEWCTRTTSSDNPHITPLVIHWNSSPISERPSYIHTLSLPSHSQEVLNLSTRNHSWLLQLWKSASILPCLLAAVSSLPTPSFMKRAACSSCSHVSTCLPTYIHHREHTQ